MKKLAIVLMMTGVFLMGSLVTEPPMANAGWTDSHGVYHKGTRPKHHRKPVKKHHVKKVKHHKKHKPVHHTTHP